MTPAEKRIIEMGNQSVMGTKPNATPSIEMANRTFMGAKPNKPTTTNTMTTPSMINSSFLNTTFNNPSIPTNLRPNIQQPKPTDPIANNIASNPTYVAGSGLQPNQAPPQPNQGDLIKKALEEAKQAEIAKQVGALQGRFNETLSDLQARRRTVPDTYKSMRVGEQTSSQLQAKNFAEFLANRGLSRSGTSQQAELMRNMSLQNAMTSINKQEQDALQYLQDQEDRARRAYSSDVANIEAGASSNYFNNYVKELQRQDENRRIDEYRRAQEEMQAKLREEQALQNKIDSDQARSDNAIKAQNEFYNSQGMAINPMTGEVVSTLQGREYEDKRNADQYKTQFDLAKETGMLSPELLVNSMNPETRNYYETLGNVDGGYAEVLKNTNNPIEKAILEYFRKQKIMNDAELFEKYGNTIVNSYIPTQSMQQDIFNMQDKDRNFGLNVDKFNYGIQRDDVADQQWGSEFGLKNWQAQDASNRGWANTAVSQGNLSLRAQELSQKANEASKDYVKRIDDELNTVEGDIYRQLQGQGKDSFLRPSKQGSAERKMLWDEMTIILSNSNLSERQKYERIQGKFTDKEIESWSQPLQTSQGTTSVPNPLLKNNTSSGTNYNNLGLNEVSKNMKRNDYKNNLPYQLR